MLFFKRQWPIIIAFCLGIVMWARYFIPTQESQTLQDEYVRWERLIYGFAAILALLSLLHHHWSKINERPGFGFSYITIIAFIIMAVAGFMPWRVPGFAGMHTDSTGLHMWMFNNMLVPMQSTMFSVLAFFIASASFRAFRARSMEATALLIAACVVMLGRVPLGEWLVEQVHMALPHIGYFNDGGKWHFASLGYDQWVVLKDAVPPVSRIELNTIYDFPQIASWLLNVPNAAAFRGITLGVILSMIAISVRIIFGIERTYMEVVMNEIVQAILNLDRRIIYTIVALLVVLPLIRPLALPIVPTPEVKGIFNIIDELPAGEHVLISADFDPASKPELLPFLDAVLAHCFIKGLKPHLLTLWPSGPGLMQTAIEREGQKYNKISGTDYCFLGYRAGTLAVILGMASSIPSTFVTDYYGKPTANMPPYNEISKISQMGYIVEIAAGATVETWITYASAPQRVPMGASVTAVSASQYYQYVQANQLTGLAGGMKGSAEYEKMLVDKYGQSNGVEPGDAIKGMDAQSAVHFFIVLSIIVANICFFFQTKYDRAQRRASA